MRSRRSNAGRRLNRQRPPVSRAKRLGRFPARRPRMPAVRVADREWGAAEAKAGLDAVAAVAAVRSVRDESKAGWDAAADVVAAAAAWDEAAVAVADAAGVEFAPCGIDLNVPQRKCVSFLYRHTTNIDTERLGDGSDCGSREMYRLRRVRGGLPDGGHHD